MAKSKKPKPGRAGKPKPKRKHAHLYPWAHVDRVAAARNVRIELGSASELLEVDVDFGLHVLQQAYVLRPDLRPSLTSLVALVAFRRATELLDGVSALIKAGCGGSATPLTRSFFEAVLHARYLMTVNDERVATAYMVSQNLAKFDQIQAGDVKHHPGSGPRIAASQREKEFEALLTEDRLVREAKRELERLREGGTVRTPWYHAFGGPRTLGAMSGRVKDRTLESLFDDRYGLWSASAHAADTLDALNPNALDPESGPDVFRPLRRNSRAELAIVIMECHTLFATMVHHQMLYFGSTPDGVDEWLRVQKKVALELIGAEAADRPEGVGP